MKIYHNIIGEGKPLFILHGLFGSSDNWMTIGKQLAEKYQVVIPDLRNHGQSPHTDQWHYMDMAKDVYELVAFLGFDQIFMLGHSMGGKTAIAFAGEYPDLLSKLVVADIAPRAYPVRHRTILEGLAGIPINDINSRKDADDHLARYVPEVPIRQFLLKNLDRDKQGIFSWKINLKTIKDHIENVGEATFPPYPINIPTLFVRGKHSDYITDEDIAAIREHFTDVSVETIGNAGHWLHAEQPEAFLKVISAFLDA